MIASSPRIDYAQYFFVKANVSALRRVRKSDNNRIARAVCAVIVNHVEDLRESDVGTRCGLFNIEKIGEECVLFFHTLIIIQNPSTLPIISHRYFNFLTHPKHAPSSSVGHLRTF